MIKKISDMEANVEKERVVAVKAIKKISTLKTIASQSKQLEDLLKRLPKYLLTNEELMISAVSLVGECFKFISPDLQKNKKGNLLNGCCVMECWTKFYYVYNF